CDVDDLDRRRDSLDHAVARTDEVVLQAEVAEERYDHPRRAGYCDDSRTSAEACSTAATSPSRSCVLASATTSIRLERAARLVSGPIVTAGADRASAP